MSVLVTNFDCIRIIRNYNCDKNLIKTKILIIFWQSEFTNTIKIKKTHLATGISHPRLLDTVIRQSLNLVFLLHRVNI